MSSETPSWLTDDNAGGGNDNFEMTAAVAETTQPAPTASTNTTTSSAAAAAAATTEVGAASDAGEEKLPKMILFMRLANMGVAIALVTCSILNMIGKLNPSVIVLAVYATCGGLLICCLETQLKFMRVIIAVNFGFLFNSVWRFLFYLLLASVTWSYESLFGYIVAACLVGCALFNTYILCRYPSYRRMREKIAAEEDKRLNERIQKEVRRAALRQVTS